MTGTTVEVTNIRSDANIIGNDALAAVAQNLEEVGGFALSDNERAFAIEIQKTLGIDGPPSLERDKVDQPLATGRSQCALSIH